MTVSVTVKFTLPSTATAFPVSAGANAGATIPVTTGQAVYPVNVPNLPFARVTGNWETRYTTQPWKSCMDLSWGCVHQGLGMMVSGTRANTKSVLEGWRSRNATGLLLWHSNYRTFAADDKNQGNNQHWKLYNYIIEGQRWQHLFHRATNYDVQAGRSLASSTVDGGEWNTAYQNEQLQQFIAEDTWNFLSDDDAGTGTPGSNSIIHLRPVIMEDNWGEFSAPKYRSADPEFNGTRTINSVVSQTVLRIDQVTLDSSTLANEEYALFAWPSAQNHSCGIRILTYTEVGGEAEIKLANSTVNWSISAGDEYFIADTNASGPNTEWDDPPGGVDLGSDPDERRQAQFDLMDGINRAPLTRFDGDEQFWLPLCTNGLGEDTFWWKRDAVRADYPTVHNGTHFARQTEDNNRLSEAIWTDDDSTYHANRYNSTQREWIMREALWGREMIDETTPSVPASLCPPAGRGVFWEVPVRRQVSDRATAIGMLEDIDAAKILFAWAFAMCNSHQFIQPKLRRSGDSPVIHESIFWYPGDPNDGAFPHERGLATITWDAVATATPETVNWRSADFGTWGFVVEFPDLLVGLNLRVPSQKNPWIPHYLPGGQSIDAGEDVYTLPSAGGGNAWYRPSQTYVNPINGYGPAVAPLTETDAVLVKDTTLHVGTKETGTINCGPLEGFALIKAAA